MPRPWFLVALVAALAAAYGLERSHQSDLEARIAARDRSIAALTTEAVRLRASVHVDTVRLTSQVTRWQTLTVHDTLPGRVDTIPVVREILAAGDSVVRACQVTVADCTKLAQVERARADSLAADVADWKKLAAGPWIRPALELTTGPGGLLPAGEVTIGHQLEAVGRLEIPLSSSPVWRVGVRWMF